MRKYRRKPAWFAYYDRVKIQQELENMAEQGWVIEQPGSYFWKYRRTEPKRVHVSVVYVADAAALNPQRTSGEQLLEELCEQDGWVLMASWGQMQIYYNEREHQTPIETDPVTQVETVYRAMKKNGLPGILSNLAISLVWIGIILWSIFKDPVNTLSHGIWLWLLPDELLLVTAAVIDLVCWKLWYRKAVAAAERGIYLELLNHRVITWVLTALSYVILAMVLLSFAGRWVLLPLCVVPVVLVTVVTGKIMEAMKRRGISKKVNLCVSIGSCFVLALAVIAGTAFIGIHFHLLDESKPVGTYERYGRERDVYADELPLRMEYLMDTGEMKWSLEKQGQSSFLVSHYEYRQWPLTDDPEVMDLDYTVTDIQYPVLYDYCKTALLKKQQDVVENGEVLHIEHYELMDEAPWGAEEAYQLHWGDGVLDDYILCYAGRIVKLDLNWTPTFAQKQIVGEKLHP